MTSEEARPPRRGRSVQKRDAILDAARDVFTADGYAGASVDAIAARAGVSKRTVYDHFGGKDPLFVAVLTRETASLVAALRTAIEEELPADADPADALLPFARRVATVAFASSEYVAFRRLVGTRGAPRGPSLPEDADPETLLAERLRDFDRAGRLRAPDPRRAAQHFVALTFTIAFEALDAPAGAGEDVDAILRDGTDAFLRAYGATAG